ncbi:hypothetical protein GN286_15160 [Rhodobacteraceae bacterium IMCC15231]|nr:hypothetical protein [Rhodobacteraceae bacterium IMCC15231]
MQKKNLGQLDYMRMYRKTGDPTFLADMIIEYGIMSNTKIAEEVAEAILKYHPQNKQWENSHDFICHYFHYSRLNDPNITYDEGAIEVLAEFERLNRQDEFSVDRIKKILQRKYEPWCRDNAK